MKSQWNTWIQMATWVGAVIGMFLFQPPVLTLSGSGGLDPLRFIHFLFAVLAAFALQFFRTTAKGRIVRLWLAGGFTLSAALLFFGYMATLNSWTCSYAVHWQVVRGENYTDDAKDVAATLPGQGRNCAEVLSVYAGAAELVWDTTETKRRYIALQALYLAFWISSAFALIFTLQIVPASQSVISDPSSMESPRGDT